MSGCAMFVQDPFVFAWCETHDETFPLGGTCPHERQALQSKAIAARARGDHAAERHALDLIHMDDQAKGQS